MELICYIKEGAQLDIRPASSRRDWMDATPDQHAYRCLPLTHANQHGWIIGCPQSFSVRWSGGPLQSDLSFTFFERGTPAAVSAFGSGILTFPLPCLFRTPPGINLWVMGPPNVVKDGVQALSGIVETDWLVEHSFTMSWKLTRPGEVFFKKGEPICFITPVPRGLVESAVPRMVPIERAPDIAAALEQGAARRRAFQAGHDIRQEGAILKPGPEQGHAWQRRYYRGLDADGEPVPGHQTRLRLRPFGEE